MTRVHSGRSRCCRPLVSGALIHHTREVRVQNSVSLITAMWRVTQWLCAVSMLCVMATEGYSAELSLDQTLILSCYRVDVDGVITALRRGANVNAGFGEGAFDIADFRDGWTGAGVHLGAENWTPLLALAAAPRLPPPPVEFPELWQDSARARRVQEQIPQRQIAARKKSQLTILRILLSHGCEVDADDGFGSTALFYAADCENVAFGRILLKYGANPNTKTQIYIDGPGDMTPLHVASGSAEMMRLLLQYGADPTAKDKDGHTPVDWVVLNQDRMFDLAKTPRGWRVVSRNR